MSATPITASGGDDTTAIQGAIDAAAGGSGGLGCVTLADGDEFSATSLDLPAGVTLSGYGATIKQSVSANFTRLITTQNETASAANNKSPARIMGLTLDGNRANQGTYTGFEKEQSHLIFASGTNVQFPLDIVDVTCRETTGDGVAIYRDARVRIQNLNLWNCFRSGVSVTGGGSIVQMDKVRADGDVHMSPLNIEFDGASTILTTTPLRSEIYISHYYAEDPALRPSADKFLSQFEARDGGTTRVDNSIFKGATWIFSNLGTFRASNSEFHWDSTLEFSRIQRPGDVAFADCTHVANNRSGSAVSPYLSCVDIIPNTATGFRIAFNNCDWKIGSVHADDVVWAVGMTASDLVDDNRLIVRGGHVPAEFAGAVRLEQGGKLSVGGDLFCEAPSLVYLLESALRRYQMQIGPVLLGEESTFGILINPQGESGLGLATHFDLVPSGWL